MNKDIWLIGAGLMAQEYISVLKGLNKKFVVIGRGEETAKKCEEMTGINVIRGGLDVFLDSNKEIASHAIVSVGVEKLYETTKLLLEQGVTNILVEKPGSLNNEELEELFHLSEEKNANVIIAYNRRFYASVLKLLELLDKEKGIKSFNFEFTEWSHKIEPLTKGYGVKEKWFLANSTHVVDLAFFLGGKPKKLSSYTSGSLSWHPSSSIFSGAGITNYDALFTYQANWESAGRWGVEVLTNKNKYILKPMEKLQVQKRGTVQELFIEDIDYSLDEKYKPGLFLQVRNFLEGNLSNMCTISEQYKMLKIYNEIANYRVL